MGTSVKKAGNRAAIRIPTSTLALPELSLEHGTKIVELGGPRDTIQISPAHETVPALGVLLARITAENRHEAVSFGPPVGLEYW